jgi:hypothetical protein
MAAMATHHLHQVTSAAAGHVVVTRPFSAEVFAHSATAVPAFYAPVPQVKATWRKTAAVACATPGMLPGRNMTDGTDIATRRPLGGLRG